MTPKMKKYIVLLICIIAIIYITLSMWAVSLNLPPFSTQEVEYVYKYNINNIEEVFNEIVTLKQIQNPENYNLLYVETRPIHGVWQSWVSSILNGIFGTIACLQFATFKGK